MSHSDKLYSVADTIVAWVRQQIEDHTTNDQAVILEGVIQSLDEMNDEILEQLDEED